MEFGEPNKPCKAIVGKMMFYLLIVGLTMFALPIGSIAIELHAGGAPLLWLTGKWFVFWAPFP